MNREKLKSTILERLNAHYDFTENQRNELCLFLIEHPKILKILIKNNWLISIEEAIEIAYSEDEKYSHLREFNCDGYFSSFSFEEDKQMIKEFITWVLAGWLLKDLIDKKEEALKTPQPPRPKPLKPD